MISLIAFGWMGYARIIRGDILLWSAIMCWLPRDRRRTAASSSATSFPTPSSPPWCWHRCISTVTLSFAALSFLGIGVEVGYADWGQVLAFARNWISSLNTYWYIIVWPGITLVLFVMGWNLLGDALRDVLDPRMRGKM